MNQDQEIVISPSKVPDELAELQNYAAVFIKSGMFPDTKNLSQGIVRIMAGREVGLAPFASMRGIDIIKGQPVFASGTIAALIRRDVRYDYRVREWTKKSCTVDIFEVTNGKREKLGDFTFDETDARDAGLLGKDNWRMYPKSMYFARALSGAARAHCPDVFGGPVYSEDELEDTGTKIITSANDLPTVGTARVESNAKALMHSLKMSIPERMDLFTKTIGKAEIPATEEEWQAVYTQLLEDSKKGTPAEEA